VNPKIPVVLLPTNPVLRLKNGPVQGCVKVLSDGVATVSTFYDVPYAQPPVGPLRWRPPQPLEREWTDILDCMEPSGIMPWQADAVPRFMPTFRSRLGLEPAVSDQVPTCMQSEDCLKLHIHTPSQELHLWNRRRKYGVMVFLHGGNHHSDSFNNPLFSPETSPVTQGQETVCVHVSHRLGLFGYLAHPGLSSESDCGASGNYGLLDIVAALKWVKDNIAVFGGDPDAVTLVGHSSGAENVLSMMVSPLATGLFHRAVVMAPGLGLHPFQHAKRHNYGGFAPMELLGR
jgi:para-nitrobenzyl esterase